MLFGVRYYNNAKNFQFALGTSAWAGNTITADTNRHVVFMNNYSNDGTLEGTILASHSNIVSLINNDYTLYLFKFNGNVTYSSNCEIYSCKIYKGTDLALDLIPAKDENNVACMFDNVSRTYFYNAGTGTFLYG